MFPERTGDLYFTERAFSRYPLKICKFTKIKKGQEKVNDLWIALGQPTRPRVNSNS
jgi:hypothetical protein